MIMHCPNPFQRMEIKANGNVYCCCEGWLPTPIGNVLERDLMEIWRGKIAEAIRGSVMDQSFRHCTACPYLPGPGGPVTSAPRSPINSDRIEVLKFDYDQSCNLTCPSCRVTHSRNFVDVPKVQQIHDAVLSSGVLDHVNRVYVTGAGDPFASALYWNFLQTLPSLPAYQNNPKMNIFLHTNGILCDARHWEEMGSARERVSEIGISVDAGTEATYKENRLASWSKLWDNIAFINHLQTTSRPDLMLGFFFTVQSNNFRELHNFCRMAFNHRASWISITALRNWGTYSREDYQQRASHLPSHPDYSDFRRVIENPQLTNDPRIILDSFNPDYTDQEIVVNPGALLPETNLRRKTT